AVFLGRINETKGIYDMLDVLKIIIKKYPDFTLAVVGPGDKITVKQYKNEIKRRRLNKNIKLLGWVSEKEKYSILKSSKIFLFLSKSVVEAFGIALLEAVCSGKPAFVYYLPIYKYIYKNKEINTFKIGDTESVAKAIIKTFKNKHFENKNGKKLLNKYSWEKIAKMELSAFKLLF
ncbi:MAG: glycosyltransferase, partial [Candidatus Shapirobacteria bacterium]|nr:glycosyltransferase [Candidatus Shapirobacteria bacterium]